jgi:hypothetical protein
MESPRKKLGSNLGPAPAFSVFTAPPAEPAPQGEGSPAAGVTSPETADAVDAQAEVAAPIPVRVAPPPSTTPPRSTAKLPVKPAPRQPARSSPQQVQPPSPAARRLHGTFSEPYQRKTGDRAQTRQTTLTVDLELDDRFESFFRRHRATYRTRSALWAAAMAYFLEAHRG